MRSYSFINRITVYSIYYFIMSNYILYAIVHRSNEFRRIYYSISAALCKPFGISDQVIERRIEREKI